MELWRHPVRMTSDFNYLGVASPKASESGVLAGSAPLETRLHISGIRGSEHEDWILRLPCVLPREPG